MMKFEILNIKDLTEAQFHKAFEDMSKERQEKCLRYKFAEDRRRMAFGEMLLRKLLAENFKAESICLKNLHSGKPVAFIGDKEIFVSISHSGDFVASAISDTPVGIDLEVKREIKPDFLRRALNEEEFAFVRDNESHCHSRQERMRFLQVWTAKEAYLKLTGEGLSGLKGAHVLPLIKGGEKDGLILKASHTADYACTVVYKQKY